MEKQIVYREIDKGEEAAACELVLRCFDEFVGTEYPAEGVEEFKKYANPASMAERLKDTSFVMLALDGERVAGVLEVRDMVHVSLLFVDKEYQGRGIARRLFEGALEKSLGIETNIEKITVNSSPYAVRVYEKLGFKQVEAEQVKNGIRYTPMVYEVRT